MRVSTDTTLEKFLIRREEWHSLDDDYYYYLLVLQFLSNLADMIEPNSTYHVGCYELSSRKDDDDHHEITT